MSNEITDEMREELWQDFRFGPGELDAFCDAADVGDLDTAQAIVERCYDRLFQEV